MKLENKEVWKVAIPGILIWLYFWITFNEPHPLIYPSALMIVLLLFLFFYKPGGKKMKLDGDSFVTALIASAVCGFIAMIISFILT